MFVLFFVEYIINRGDDHERPRNDREQLEALVQQQAQAAKKNVVVKVSQKGCVQINGIRRFPITFYKNEWEQIFAMKDEIVQFIEDNDHLLAKNFVFRKANSEPRQTTSL